MFFPAQYSNFVQCFSQYYGSLLKLTRLENLPVGNSQFRDYLCHKAVCLRTKIFCTDAEEATNLEGLEEKLAAEDHHLHFA
jgi:hypothetical protein